MGDGYESEKRFLEMSLPAGAILVLVEAYIDETGTNDGDPVHCLAGYIIKPGQGLEMARKWQIVLRRYGLPFFHMTDCAAYEHCEPYKTLGRDECIKLATTLIKLIKRYCLSGFAVCFSPKFYSVYKDNNIQSQEPYAFSVGLVHSHIQATLREFGHEGDVSYIFEAKQKLKQSRLVLDRLYDDAEKNGIIFSSSFQPKSQAALLQAADILAWHCQTYIKRKIKGCKVRADFRSLLDIPHLIYHFSNPFEDGVKNPDITVIALDRFPGDDAESIQGMIKVIYEMDLPIPSN